MLVSKRNQYFGINAHTNSWILDREGEWGSFHARHIVDIAQQLDEVLPQGYEARPERSLQVKTSLDVQDEEELTAVVIYKVDDSADVGKPVTRIELLSPTNKLPGKGYEQYRLKRNAALASQIPLIEIDYVHQRRPVVELLAGYPNVPNTHPYHIIVTDTRPSLREGITSIYSFDVDMPIPTFDIPLDQGAVTFDLNAVYNTTFRTTRTLQRVADYSQPPVQIEKYSAEDQRRIQRRMAMITALEHAGHDLNDDGPFPLDNTLTAQYLSQTPTTSD